MLELMALTVVNQYLSIINYLSLSETLLWVEKSKDDGENAHSTKYTNDSVIVLHGISAFL